MVDFGPAEIEPVLLNEKSAGPNVLHSEKLFAKTALLLRYYRRLSGDLGCGANLSSALLLLLRYYRRLSGDLWCGQLHMRL